LASSGVGTFVIAAALCSRNLKNFYHSDAYSSGHLNPEMLVGINTHCIRLGEGYIKLGMWAPGEQNTKFLLEYEVATEQFEGI